MSLCSAVASRMLHQEHANFPKQRTRIRILCIHSFSSWMDTSPSNSKHECPADISHISHPKWIEIHYPVVFKFLLLRFICLREGECALRIVRGAYLGLWTLQHSKIENLMLDVN